MALWSCAECTAAYSVGATRCPQCGSTVRMEDTATAEPQPITLVCRPGDGCPAAGVERQVWLRLAAPGVVERPSLRCATCGGEMWEISESEETDMAPKVTVHTGASIEEPDPDGEGATTRWVGGHGPDTPEPNVESPTETGSGPAYPGDDPDSDGGEQSSPGKNSPTSSESQPSGSETTETATRSRARSAGSRSGKGRTDSSTAGGTGGDPTAAASETASEDSK